MKKGSHKGYVNIPATDPKTGQRHTVIVPVDSGIARRHRAGAKKLQKQNTAAFREFKKNLKIAKKAIPLAQRAQVNWSEVESKTEQVEVFEPVDKAEQLA